MKPAGYQLFSFDDDRLSELVDASKAIVKEEDDRISHEGELEASLRKASLSGALDEEGRAELSRLQIRRLVRQVDAGHSLRDLLAHVDSPTNARGYLQEHPVQHLKTEHKHVLEAAGGVVGPGYWERRALGHPHYSVRCRRNGASVEKVVEFATPAVKLPLEELKALAEAPEFMLELDEEYDWALLLQFQLEELGATVSFYPPRICLEEAQRRDGIWDTTPLAAPLGQDDLWEALTSREWPIGHEHYLRLQAWQRSNDLYRAQGVPWVPLDRRDERERANVARLLELLHTNLPHSAVTIAEIYRERRQFSKALKLLKSVTGRARGEWCEAVQRLAAKRESAVRRVDGS